MDNTAYDAIQSVLKTREGRDAMRAVIDVIAPERLYPDYQRYGVMHDVKVDVEDLLRRADPAGFVQMERERLNDLLAQAMEEK